MIKIMRFPICILLVLLLAGSSLAQTTNITDPKLIALRKNAALSAMDRYFTKQVDEVTDLVSYSLIDEWTIPNSGMMSNGVSRLFLHYTKGEIPKYAGIRIIRDGRASSIWPHVCIVKADGVRIKSDNVKYSYEQAVSSDYFECFFTEKEMRIIASSRSVVMDLDGTKIDFSGYDKTCFKVVSNLIMVLGEEKNYLENRSKRDVTPPQKTNTVKNN